MKFLKIILAGFVVYFAYTTNLWLGLVITLAVLIYFITKLIPFIYKNKSRKAFADGRFNEAKALYQKAMQHSDNDFNARLEYSYMLMRTGDFDEAQQIMDAVLAYKLEPANRKRAILQRCLCYYKNGNLDEAYNDAVELYNDGYRTMILYGLLGYFKLVKAPASDDTYNFCLEAYDYADDDRDICDNMLICYYNRGEYEKAKKISDKVLESNPMFVEAWYHGAQIDVVLGDYHSARAKLDKIPECNRSAMTTIPIEAVTKLNDEVNEKLKEKI